MSTDRESLLQILKAQVLVEERGVLVKRNLVRYIPYLRSKYMISTDDHEEIEALTTTRKKSDRIIDILLSRGPKAYDHLCSAIRDNGMEDDLVVHLNRKLEIKYDQAIGTNTLPLTEDTSFDLPRPSQQSTA